MPRRKVRRKAVVAENGTALIFVAGGRCALVDAVDVDIAEQYAWHIVPRGTGYAAVRVGRTTVYLHRLIAGAVAGEHVDHINHDTLDCRRANLRRCTNAENARNKLTTTGSSRFKGVCFHKQTRKWQAQIVAGRRAHYLGLHATEEAAAQAYDAAAKLHHGSFAHLNYPEIVENRVGSELQNRERAS